MSWQFIKSIPEVELSAKAKNPRELINCLAKKAGFKEWSTKWCWEQSPNLDAYNLYRWVEYRKVDRINESKS